MPFAVKSYCRFLPALFFVLISTSAFTQKSPGKPDEETLRLIAAAPDEKGKETGALIILKDYHFTVNDKGQTKVILRVLGKVYSREAVSDFSTVPLRFNSFYEEPHLEYARVINKDGSTREVRKDAVQIKNLPEMEGYQFTDARYISFAFSGLEPGSAFDYLISFTHKTPIIEGTWSEHHMFSSYLRVLTPPYIPRIDPCLTSRFILTIPKGKKFSYSGSMKIDEPETISTATQDQYTWTVRDIPAVITEDGMPSIGSIIPLLYVTSINDWAEVDRWASGKILAKVEVTEEIVQKVQELTSGKSSEEEKIKAITGFIQSNINYVYTDLERGGYEAHPAGEIYKSRYGDCKDQTVLLISMLRAAGIEAWPVLINPYPMDQFSDLPSIYFTHLITCVNAGGKKVFLDMTSDVTPFPELPFVNQQRKVFIINGKGGVLTTTPGSKAEQNLTSFDMVTTFLEGNAFLKLRIDAHGIMSDMLKTVLGTLDDSSIRDSFKNIPLTVSESAVIDTIIHSDFKDPQANFSAAVDFHIDSIWHEGQGMVAFASHTSLFLAMVMSLDTKSFPEKRRYDMIGGYSNIITGREKYYLPERDLIPVSYPRMDSLINDYFSFRQDFRSDSMSFETTFSIKTEDLVVPKEKYGNYVNSIKALNTISEWQVNYVEPVSFLTYLVSNESLSKIMSDCNKMLREEPGNIYALLAISMAYTRNNQHDEAINACKEAIAINPNNKYGHYFIAFPYIAKKAPHLAIASLSRAIAIDPDFQIAVALRASQYADNKMHKQALTDLDSGLMKDPESMILLRAKVSVLAGMGKMDEAFPVLYRMAELDSANVELLETIAEFCINTNRIDTAIILYNRALRIDNKNPVYYGNLGWIYYLKNDDNKCIEYSQKAVDLKPDTWFARYNIGLAKLRSGKVAESRGIYSELKQLGNKIPPATRFAAVKDLNDLRDKGIKVKEIRAILRDYFDQ